MAEPTLKCEICGTPLVVPAGVHRIVCGHCKTEKDLAPPHVVVGWIPWIKAHPFLTFALLCALGCGFPCFCTATCLPWTGHPAADGASSGLVSTFQLGCLVLFGSTPFLAAAAIRFRNEWRARHTFVKHTCFVLSKFVRVFGTYDGTNASYRPEICIQYTVGGREYVIWTYDVNFSYSGGRSANQRAIDRFIVAHEYPCWYDPDDPSKAVVVLDYSGRTICYAGTWLLLVIVGISLCVWGL